jgi:uncharacterized protein YdaU (DUF1376 family)
MWKGSGLNYYEHHIGDYLKDTAHLSLLEHGVYLRLLQVYYTREVGIPTAQAARLVGARSPEELEALETVLKEFFEIRDGLWVQGRCEKLIDKHHQFIEKQKHAAAKRWDTNGNASADATAMPPHVSGISTGNAVGIPPSPTSHSPLPTTQSRKKEPTASATPPAGWFDAFKAAYPKRAGDQGWPKALRAAHARITEGHDPAEFLAGAERYAAFCLATDAIGTAYVKQAATFLGPDKPFLQPWPPPLSKSQLRQDANVAVSLEWLEKTDAAN